jgi:hypothetical protein
LSVFGSAQLNGDRCWPTGREHLWVLMKNLTSTAGTDLAVRSDAHRCFSWAILMFAITAGLGAAWVLGTELTRRATILNVMSGVGDDANATSAAVAWQAARIGAVRGDLWAEAAFAYAGFHWSDPNSAASWTPEAFKTVRTAAERALEFSPGDSRVWLLLASMDSNAGAAEEMSIAPLKMSYYTGPNEVELIPLRLLVSVRSRAMADDELQQLVYSQIRSIVTRRASLKPAIDAAYRAASPIGKQFIEQTLGELDPALLVSIRSDASHP